MVITPIRGLIPPFITTHEPPSRGPALLEGFWALVVSGLKIL